MNIVEQVTDIISDYHEDHERPYDWISSDLAQALDAAGMLRPEWAIADASVLIAMTIAVRDMIVTHFQELRMDTTEDEELRKTMLSVILLWSNAIDAYVDSVEPK